MKYNDNGEYKDIYVKAFDTLPVGAIIEFDGSTIPNGWEDIGNNKIKKTSQYIEGGATISNEYGTSQVNGYAQDFINNNFTSFVSSKSVKIQMGQVATNSSLEISGSIVVIISFMNSNNYAQFGCRSGDITTFTKTGTAISCSVSGTTYTLSNSSSSTGLRYIAFIREE